MPNSPYQKRGKSLTWSNTRITLLEYCERKYYLNYYTFALKEPHHELWTEALVLKGLKSMEMRIGEKSHYLLSDYLHLLKQHTTAALALDEKIQEIKQQLKAEMEAEFAFSKARNYQDDKNFFGKFGLSEHFYGEDKDTALQPAIEKVWTNLDHFIASKWNEKVQDYFTSAKFIYIEYPRVPDYNAMKVDISQLP
ncbi:MAG: hypothetical protein LBG59_06580 [Candidatus Peribacteria bacterium]|jgi:hypothetical protein|nr:hypothetical protein [Candidatus Peribacteria bacterium]